MYNETVKIEFKKFFMTKSKKYFIAGLCFSAIILFAGIAKSQNAEDFYQKANLSLTSGKMTEAVKFYNQSISCDENYFEAYLGLSIAYRELKQYDKALESINTAINLNPEYFQAYYNLGLILEQQNKNIEAIKAYEKFLKGVPGAAKFSDAKQRIFKLKENQ